MPKVSAALITYNEKEFISPFLSNIVPVFDDIVIVEGSWDGGPYDYGGNYRSDDGTRETINYIASSHPHVRVFDSVGDDCLCFNLATLHCQNDWIFFFGTDEFYHRRDLFRVLKFINDNPQYNGIIFPEYSFYFNFRRFIKSERLRVVNFNGRNWYTANGVGDNIEPHPDKVHHFDAHLYHYQWMGNRDKVISSKNIQTEENLFKSIGMAYRKEDGMPLEGYWEWWIEEIYKKFDGTEERERELLEKARGSFHPWSYRTPEFRQLELETLPRNHIHPECIRDAPFFDLDEKGIIDFGN